MVDQPNSQRVPAGQSGTGNGIFESLFHKVTEPALAKMKTLSDFLLTLLIAANIYAVYYGLRYGLPSAITSINSGHKEAREDFRMMLQEDRAVQAANQERLFQLIRNHGFGNGNNGGNPNNGFNWNNGGGAIHLPSPLNGFGKVTPLPSLFMGDVGSGPGAVNASPNVTVDAESAAGSE